MLAFADQSVAIQGPALIFSNPLLAYSWKRSAGRETGFLCLFTESFIDNHLKTGSIAESILFRAGGTPVVFPDAHTQNFLVGMFEQMLVEMQSMYRHKYELLRSFVQIILHESLKWVPPSQAYGAGTTAARITALFLQLLDRQFPIVSPLHPLRLKNANEFAAQLSVHTNHLNKALKATTGKTTSELMAEKWTNEAKALLTHTDWDITEIGYVLGFGYSANFHSFFKKQTGLTPSHFRRQRIAVS